MSYSRWGSSRWYTYWTTDSGDTLETQKLSIDCSTEATYAELTADFEGTLNRVIKDIVDGGYSAPVGDERAELAGYMRQFMCEMKAGVWEEA